MWNYLWPILIVVGANTFYNISTKSTPQGIDPFASLTITYLVAAALSLLMFFVTGEQKNLLTEFSKANCTSFLLGISVVALEFGYISIYRAGWKVSTASLVANIMKTPRAGDVRDHAAVRFQTFRQAIVAEGVGSCAIGAGRDHARRFSAHVASQLSGHKALPPGALRQRQCCSTIRASLRS